MLFYVRAADLDYLWALHERVVACAEGAAKATGTTLKVIDYRDTVYEPMKRNDAFRVNLRAVGEIEAPEVRDRLGSSDVGNVSQVIPCIQPLMTIAPDGTPIHSRDFEAAAVTPARPRRNAEGRQGHGAHDLRSPGRSGATREGEARVRGLTE